MKDFGLRNPKYTYTLCNSDYITRNAYIWLFKCLNAHLWRKATHNENLDNTYII